MRHHSFGKPPALLLVPKWSSIQSQKTSDLSSRDAAITSPKGRAEWMGGAEWYLPLAVVDKGRECVTSHRGPATPIRHRIVYVRSLRRRHATGRRLEDIHQLHLLIYGMWWLTCVWRWCGSCAAWASPPCSPPSRHAASGASAPGLPMPWRTRTSHLGRYSESYR